MQTPEPTEFVPIDMIGGATDQAASVPSPESCREEHGSIIGIELPTGARVRVDALANEKVLARVFRAMKGLV